MATTPEQFFSKNMKWIALVLFILLSFKTIQSCNRDTLLNIESSQYVEEIDSLKTAHNIEVDSLQDVYDIYYDKSQDSIKELNYGLRLAGSQVTAANDKADAVENAVEKIRANTTTTVVFKGAEEVKDTTKIEKK